MVGGVVGGLPAVSPCSMVGVLSVRSEVCWKELWVVVLCLLIRWLPGGWEKGRMHEGKAERLPTEQKSIKEG